MASNTRTSPHDQDRIIAQLEQALAEQNQKIDQLAQRITLQDQRINLQSQTIDALNSKVAAAAEKTHKHDTQYIAQIDRLSSNFEALFSVVEESNRRIDMTGKMSKALDLRLTGKHQEAHRLLTSREEAPPANQPADARAILLNETRNHVRRELEEASASAPVQRDSGSIRTRTPANVNNDSQGSGGDTADVPEPLRADEANTQSKKSKVCVLKMPERKRS
ncbi:MAG: hypothetical protein LQ346_005832 [Caloplaca aetnensis]|nr:MAG: hypothetical protein LQ346_005832 [Caloplaca aetnensis]